MGQWIMIISTFKPFMGYQGVQMECHLDICAIPRPEVATQLFLNGFSNSCSSVYAQLRRAQNLENFNVNVFFENSLVMLEGETLQLNALIDCGRIKPR